MEKLTPTTADVYEALSVLSEYGKSLNDRDSSHEEGCDCCRLQKLLGHGFILVYDANTETDNRKMMKITGAVCASEALTKEALALLSGILAR